MGKLWRNLDPTTKVQKVSVWSQTGPLSTAKWENIGPDLQHFCACEFLVWKGGHISHVSQCPNCIWAAFWRWRVEIVEGVAGSSPECVLVEVGRGGRSRKVSPFSAWSWRCHLFWETKLAYHFLVLSLLNIELGSKWFDDQPTFFSSWSTKCNICDE